MPGQAGMPGQVGVRSRPTPANPTSLVRVLPYPSYLRIYEPLHALSASVQERLGEDRDALTKPGQTLASEQQTSLTRLVSSGALTLDPGQLPGSYVMRRDGRSFFCPTDLPLRSWLSLTSLVQNVGGATAHLLFTADSLASADAAFLRWRQDNPRALPHIKQTTWGVPRTWFVLVIEEERERYDVGGVSSARYRAHIDDARQRVADAYEVLSRLIDDADLLEDLLDLGSWLDAFDDESWVELDYAGVARLLGAGLATEHSAGDIQAALDALKQGDYAAAGAAYGAFEQRWRSVNAHERAN